MRERAANTVRGTRNRVGDEFYEEIKDIINHPMVKEMKNYIHHSSTDCYQHCLNVSYYNYIICRLFNLDARSAARAGMIHDMFLYDWRTHASQTGEYFHAMTHPRKALNNAKKYFELNDLEQEIIIHHMWPVTLVPPQSLEAFIITLTDKMCGLFEFIRYYTDIVFPERIFRPNRYYGRLLKKSKAFSDYLTLSSKATV